MKKNIKKEIGSFIFILIGTFIMAAGYVFFIAPYKLAPGGVYGIAITIHHATKGLFEMFMDGLPIGMTALSMDIPLFILAIVVLGPKFGLKTFIGFTSLAAFTDLISFWWGGDALVQSDPLLSSIFSGVLIGLGLGLIFKSKATSGGTDIIAMIVTKYTKLPLGSTVIIVDSIVVFATLFVYRDWTLPLYSLVVIFITGKVVDMVIQGIRTDKTVYIISDKNDEIRDLIINTLERGGTFIHGEGMFNGSPKKMIYTIVDRKQLPILIDYVKTIDPNAFLSVVEATETLGLGFKSIHNSNFSD